MADTLKLELVSPERELASRVVRAVLVPGLEGYFEVRPGHAPVLSILRPGVLRITEISNAETKFFVRGGYVEVGGDEVSVLAEYAAPLEQFTPDQLAQEIRWAEEDLADARNDEERRKLTERLDFLRALKTALETGF